MNNWMTGEEVLCTRELEQRPSRRPDFEAENRVLSLLAQRLAESPEGILQGMVEIMPSFFRVGSAGCSVLVDKGEGVRFYWPAITGTWRGYIEEGMPRDRGPAGDLLDCNTPMLFRRPQRRYECLAQVTPAIEECLVVPFHIGSVAIGALWLVSHDANRTFDMEDLRQLLVLGLFASSAHQATIISERMRGMNEALLLSSLRQHEFAEAEEKLNELLRDEIRAHKAVEVQLMQATVAAQQASLSKTDFLTNMSHELRTPLNAILGHAQVMELATVLDAIQKRSVTQIQKAGWYLAELINEVLDLAQVEAGKLSVRLESVGLAEVLQECEAMMEPLAKTRDITLNFPYTESTVRVLGDRTRLKQVLINLLSNAIKYNRKGGSVIVDCAVVGEEQIRISVRDTGEGLTEVQLSQLFQMFNRLGQEAHGVSGSGIGLVMTKRLTELMGGTVGAESVVGTGSAFWVELKLAAVAPEELVMNIPALRTVAVARTDAPKTLLYVEDNPSNRMVMHELMSHRPDFRLLSAHDGARGIAVARAAHPDVILLDIKLPDISGLQVASILAASPDTAHIPVVGFSARAMPEDIHKAMEAGFFDYLTKPVKFAKLMDTLDKALAAHA